MGRQSGDRRPRPRHRSREHSLRIYTLIELNAGVDRDQAGRALRQLIHSQPALRPAEGSGSWRGLEDLPDAADPDLLGETDTAGEPLRAFWSPASGRSGPRLVLALDARLADGHALALAPRLIEAALAGRPVEGAGGGEAPSAESPTDMGDRPASRQAGARLHEDGDGVVRRRAHRVAIELPAGVWSELQRVALDLEVTPLAIGWTAFAVVVERLAESPAPLWRPLGAARTPADLLRIGPATPWMRLAPSPVARESFAGAVREAAVRTAALAGAVLAPLADEPVYGFEIDDAAALLAEHHPGLTLGQAVLDARPWPHSPADADLWLTLRPPAGGGPATATLAVDAGRFSAGRAKGFIDSWRFVLEAALADPAARPDDLPLAPAHHRAASQAELADRPATALDDAPADLAALFDRIVARWPERRALAWPAGEMTFAALQAAADAVAGDLKALGARRGDRIAFRQMDKPTAEGLVLSLAVQLAALRLGGALVPLGVQLQADQARAQVAGVGARFLIATGAAADCLPPDSDAAAGGAVTGFADARLFPLAGNSGPDAAPAPSDDTAIVFTSSGTTGVPKSILVGQAMLMGLLRGLTASGGLPSLPYVMGANIAFDVFIIDVWIPWLSGLHVVLLPTERRSPAVIAEACALGAGAMSLSSTVAAAALDDDPACFAGLKTLHLMGEVLPPALLARLTELAPHLTVVNGYGPAETAVLSNTWRARPGAWASLPIGQALPGYRVLIGDERARALPAHWPGELLIAPAAPALGYLDRELTAERFIELPGEAPGPFFRSGDHGWVNEAGEVMFIGRRDRQVKLAGVRIEMDGIEHRIAEVEGVAQVGVVLVGAQGAERLVAFVQPQPGQASNAPFRGRILDHCRSGLLRAATPSAVVFLSSIPVGPTGKKSHSALRALLASEPAPAAGGSPASPPADPIVDRLTLLWAEVLKRRGVQAADLGADQDLAALGASSLDMLRMAERVERAFGIRILDAQFLLQPTIARQAEFVSALQRRGGDAPAAHAPSKGAERHLVRLSNGAGGPGAVVIGMPELHGAVAYVGHITSRGLPGHEVWGFSCDTGGSDLITNGGWFDCARSIADQLLESGPERPAAFIGFSFGGFLAWLVDRMLVAAGRAPTPIVNLDGAPLHVDREDWMQRVRPIVDAAGPAPGRATRARMLLVQVAASPRFLREASMAPQWRDVDLDLAVCDIPTVTHLDFCRPWPMTVYREALESFLSGPSGGDPGRLAPLLAGDPPPPGARAFQALAAAEPPRPEAVRAIAEAMPPGDLDPDLGAALLFLALAAGEAALALDLAAHARQRDPRLRWAAYGEVCAHLALGAREAALAAADGWSRLNADDPALLTRATGAPPAAVPWSAMVDLRIDSDRGLDLALALGLTRR